MTEKLSQQMAEAMGMSDAVWRRHANPWSVWTRVAILPLLTLAIWSRLWIGWWALVPVALLTIWTWLNPRAFPPPKSTNSWASRAVLGERVYLNRRAIPIPPHHERAALSLMILSGVGLPFLVWGLWTFALWPTLLGNVLIITFKLWFLDRMVWLLEEMKQVRKKNLERKESDFPTTI